MTDDLETLAERRVVARAEKVWQLASKRSLRDPWDHEKDDAAMEAGNILRNAENALYFELKRRGRL